MKSIKLFVLFVFALSFSVPSLVHANDDALVEQAKTYFRQQMKDPESTNFRNIVVVHSPTKTDPDNKNVCGELNSKNSYRAYVGFKPFHYQNGFGEFLN